MSMLELKACHGMWQMLDKLGREKWPTFVRGDCGYGNEAIMLECETRRLPYLFKLRHTVKVKLLVQQMMRQGALWLECGDGWQALESSLKLTGWSQERRVVLVREAPSLAPVSGPVIELDADAVEIATEWRIEKSARYSKNRCVLGVVYRVVATTRGSGMPSWNRPQGREIWPLAKPVERLVKFEIVRVGSDWRIVSFPIPYVTPKAMKEFFATEIERVESIVVPADQDQRAVRNREVIRVWRKRQLDVLNKLFEHEHKVEHKMGSPTLTEGGLLQGEGGNQGRLVQ